jgi:low affinity Fe/Cu permease
MSSTKKRDIFTKFTTKISSVLGHAWVFVVALAVLLAWALTGPLLGFSDTWQLIINTSTTIVTFLMVFLIQNTQNRDSAAVHLKLDELIRTVNGAHNALLDLEELTEADLEQLRARYESLGRTAREDLRRHGGTDTDTPEVPVEGRLPKRPEAPVSRAG